MGLTGSRVAAVPPQLDSDDDAVDATQEARLVRNESLASEDSLTVASEAGFPDLRQLPPEVALAVLKNLNATDLCLAACVWQQLASDEILWQGLCRQEWGEASIYRVEKRPFSFKKVFLLLDEGTLTFNVDARKGMDYFVRHGLVSDGAAEMASFLQHTRKLSRVQVRAFLQDRPDVVECLMAMQDYAGQFLPNALRKCFAKLEAPQDRGAYLHQLLDAFARRFCQCNPALGYSVDSVYVLCFSLILLSVDLTSPHVKNKMSKREFIRNTRNAVVADHAQQHNNHHMQHQQPVVAIHNHHLAQPHQRNNVRVGASNGDDLFGELYDNVFLRGHVGCAAEGGSLMKLKNQFVPGYLALFL